MRQITATADIGNGAELETFSTIPIIVDQYQDPTAITFFTSSAGTVEVSYADPFPKENGNFVEQTTWNWQTPDLTKFPNGPNFIGHPIRAIRLTGAADGDTLTIIQAGVKG